MNDIGKQLAIINHSVKRRIEQENQCELMKVSAANGYILIYLHDNRDRDVFQKNIEETFGITRSSASKIISLMETKGLIERHTVPGDARLKRLSITALGEEMRQNMICSRTKMEETLTRGFSGEELVQLYGFLERIKNNLGDKGECKND